MCSSAPRTYRYATKDPRSCCSGSGFRSGTTHVVPDPVMGFPLLSAGSRAAPPATCAGGRCGGALLAQRPPRAGAARRRAFAPRCAAGACTCGCCRSTHRTMTKHHRTCWNGYRRAPALTPASSMAWTRRWRCSSRSRL